MICPLFMSDQYHHPTTHGKSTKPNLKTVVISQQQKMRKMRVELVQTYASLINATDEVEQLTLNNATLEGQMGDYQKLKNEIRYKCNAINDLKREIASLNPRNVNKRFKRCKKQIQNLQNQVKTQGEILNDRITMMLNENNELEKELGDLRGKICHSKTKYTQALKMKSYFKGKYKSVNKKAEESKIDSKKT
ncbi:unnamed protein product [Mytilus edulis]|uniref:Uncharacterized protein n=1 Tax=Mytilus edulis TaxID=6550 RepID=A0A8S3RDJ0_MYTED|nr:unnamed protein product [Mytilus edulis]